MDRFTVACIQQRMRLPQTRTDYQEELRRFLRAAERKNARLVVFPELAGLMVLPPLLGDFRSGLLKRADRGRRRSASMLQKLTGTLSGNLATMLKADLRKSIAGLLDVAGGDVASAYQEIFGGLAREFGLTIVAPSAYLPDPLDGVIRNLTGVFGPGGEPLGFQSKVLLHPEDADIAQPGSTWDVIQTEVGRIGLMLGSDVLYPEVGRLLAYQGAEVLVTQGACPAPVLYSKVRSGMLARMQDNQLFGVVSFLVGQNELSHRQRDPYVGKSAVFAPQELTPRLNGVLVEMGNHRSEGVLTAEWDFVALKELWETSDTPVRQQLPMTQVSQLLAQLYENVQKLPRITDFPQLPAADAHEEGDDLLMLLDDEKSEKLVVHLDDLPVLNSVTMRWPLVRSRGAGTNGPGTNGAVTTVAELDEEMIDLSGLPSLAKVVHAEGASAVGVDDETEEMDALS